MNPPVSVIVTTRNRAGHLARLLPSLTHLTYDALEVVVVAGPSNDGTDALVAEWADRVKVVRSPAANMCLSRNLGIAAAAGDILVFIDDDAVPETTGWLEHLVAPFVRDARVGAAGGPVLLADGDVHQFRNGAVSEWGEHVFVTGTRSTAADVQGWFPRAMGTNAAFRREALLAVGGFDERIAYYGDECDVCVRIARAGWSFAHAEGAVVRHHPAPSIHRHLVDRTRIHTHDDTYFVMRHASRSVPGRVAGLLRRLPARHYVHEARAARRSQQLSRRDYARFWALLAIGAVQGIVDGVFRPRRLMNVAAAPPVLKRLPRWRPERRLSVALLTRALACDGPVEGTARYTYELALGLHALGHDVHVIGESPLPRRHLRLGLTVHGIGPRDFGPRLFPAQPMLDTTVTYALAVAARVRALASRGCRFDVVHATNWNLEAVGVLMDAQVPVAMMLVTSLSDIIEKERWVPGTDLQACVLLDRAQIRAAAVLCAPSHGLVAHYVHTSMLDERQASGVEICGLGILPRADASRRRSASGRRLLFVGTHVRRKGLDDLLAVLPELLAAHPEWSCDIAGDDTRQMEDGGTLKDAFLDAHAQAPWLNRVTFHGRVDEPRLWELYRSASLYVLPSRFESFGLTYLEAMQFGLPVVGTTAGGIPEVVEDGATGVLVPPADRGALAAALAELMRDDARRDAMGQRARAHVFDTGTHVHMARRLVPVYERARATYVARANAPRRRPSQAVIGMIADAGAPEALQHALDRTGAYDGDAADRERLVDAALGVLPSCDLYLDAVARCLTKGDIARARRLVTDAAAAGHVDEATRAGTLDFLGWLEADAAAGRPPAATGAAPPTLHDAILLLRDDSVVPAMVGLYVLVGHAGTRASDRLLATYHLSSALKRVGRVDAARAGLDRVTAAADFGTLPSEVRAAAWFHLGELRLASGETAQALGAFERCLTLNPAHGRAAMLARQVAGEDKAS